MFCSHLSTYTTTCRRESHNLVRCGDTSLLSLYFFHAGVAKSPLQQRSGIHILPWTTLSAAALPSLVTAFSLVFFNCTDPSRMEELKKPSSIPAFRPCCRITFWLWFAFPGRDLPRESFWRLCSPAPSPGWLQGGSAALESARCVGGGPTTPALWMESQSGKEEERSEIILFPSDPETIYRIGEGLNLP